MQNSAIQWKSSAAWATFRMKIHDHQEVIQKYRLLSSCGSFPCNTELPNLLCLSDLSQRKGGYVQEAFMSYAWDGTHTFCIRPWSRSQVYSHIYLDKKMSCTWVHKMKMKQAWWRVGHDIHEHLIKETKRSTSWNMLFDDPFHPFLISLYYESD